MIEKTLGYIIKVNKTDSINTVGKLATSIWFGGCSARCEGCHNPETWKLKNGVSVDYKALDKILNDIPSGFNMSLLGGDPLEMQNLEATKYLINNFKKKNPDADVLIWTGKNFNVAKGLLGSSFNNVDFLKTGLFEIHNFKKNLKYYGSTNQFFFHVRGGEPVAIWSDAEEQFINNVKEVR